jgi:hypothetical protein
VIGFDLCPFAARVYDNDQIQYSLEESANPKDQIIAFWNCIHSLSNSDKFTTAFLLLPNASRSFDEYLDLYDKCDWILKETKKDQEFQIAGFHPNYLFDQSDENDPANYTNRSPFPMIHILYVEDVHKASKNHPDIDSVPLRNIRFLRSKGLESIQNILNSII